MCWADGLKVLLCLRRREDATKRTDGLLGWPQAREAPLRRHCNVIAMDEAQAPIELDHHRPIGQCIQ